MSVPSSPRFAAHGSLKQLPVQSRSSVGSSLVATRRMESGTVPALRRAHPAPRDSHKLKPGDDSDPASDAVILQAHKKMGFVPPNADGFSKDHWGHSRISNDSGEHLYNRYTDEQYDAANKRYMQYHDNQIDYLRKLKDGGLVRNLQGRETGRRKRMRTIDGQLGFREMTGTGLTAHRGRSDWHVLYL